MRYKKGNKRKNGRIRKFTMIAKTNRKYN